MHHVHVIKYWAEDGSLEPKHLTKLYIIDYTHIMRCLTEEMILWAHSLVTTLAELSGPLLLRLWRSKRIKFL